jgi:hypothetical protein
MDQPAPREAVGSAMPSSPGQESWMPYFKYRLHWADGSDAGEAEYVSRVKPGELVWIAGGKQLRVLDVVETPEPQSRYEGLLRVEADGGGG